MQKSFWMLTLMRVSMALLDVDFSSRESIRAAAALKAQDLMSFYHGHDYGQTPGILPGPPPKGEYFWWHAGALWGTMIDYWKYTGDSSYNDIVKDSLLFQAGPNQDYMPPNITMTIGNDDQAFWGMSAMLAAESNFQDPPIFQPQWLALTQAVYNSQTLRLDSGCGGGLRWQVVPMNQGYGYKNSITNGAYFNMAARLARYTQESTYADSAQYIFEWMMRIGLISQDYNVFDGAHEKHDCTDINGARYSYSAAVLLQGAAFMWDFTKDDRWRRHVDGLLDSILSAFYRDNIAYEPICDGNIICNMDMKTFKSLNIRWMASTVQLCPWTQKRILPALRASAKAAVAQCTGGANGRMCGTGWWSEISPSHVGEFDGQMGLGQEMAALAALMTAILIEERTLEDSALVEVQSGSSRGSGSDSASDLVSTLESGSDSDLTLATIPKPVTHNTGGTSRGDSRAGGRLGPGLGGWKPPTKADVAGAAFLTASLVVAMAVMVTWMCIDSLEPGAQLVFPDEDIRAESCEVSSRGEGERPLLESPERPQHPRILALKSRGKGKGKSESNVKIVNKRIPTISHDQENGIPKPGEAMSQYRSKTGSVNGRQSKLSVMSLANAAAFE